MLIGLTSFSPPCHAYLIYVVHITLSSDELYSFDYPPQSKPKSEIITVRTKSKPNTNPNPTQLKTKSKPESELITVKTCAWSRLLLRLKGVGG